MSFVVRPVFDGKWHLTTMTRRPIPRDDITTLCGLTHPATDWEPDSPNITQCWDCDLTYRRQNKMSLGPGIHPALAERATTPEGGTL